MEKRYTFVSRSGDPATMYS